MKAKRTSPWVGAGAGCLIGALVSIVAIAAIRIVTIRTDSEWSGSLIRVISYLPYVTAIIGFIIVNNRRTKDEILATQNPADLDERVLELLGRGLSNSEIAERLGISVVQVSLSKSELMRRFNFATETELVEEARRRGFLPTDKT